MEENAFSHYLLGRLVSMEARLRAELQPPAAAAPAPVPEPKEPSAADQNAYFLDNLTTIAGVKPPQQVAQEAAPPATLSKASPRYAQDFARYAAAIADGTTLVVD